MTKMKPQKLTRAVEKRITEDWAREFPGMGAYKRRWLMRRVGPLLIGISLDRDSHGDLYKPSVHVFFLGRHWPASEPALTLNESLRTSRTHAPDDVEVREHEEKYLDAVQRMKEQALLPLDGPVTLDEVLEAYRTHHERAPMGKPSLTSHVILMCDVILLLVWCGRTAEAERMLQEVLESVSDERSYRHPYGSREAFDRAMREAIEHPGTLREQVERQIERLGVQELPVSELLC